MKTPVFGGAEGIVVGQRGTEPLQVGGIGAAHGQRGSVCLDGHPQLEKVVDLLGRGQAVVGDIVAGVLCPTPRGSLACPYR